MYDRDFVYLEGAHHHDNGSKTIVAFSVNHPASLFFFDETHTYLFIHT